MQLLTRSFTISECISEVTRSGPSSISPNILDYRIKVHLWSCLITASTCITEFTVSAVPCTPPISHIHYLQPVQIYQVGIGIYLDISMRIQTNCTSFNKCRTMSSSFDFLVHQQCPQGRCGSTLTPLPWNQVLPGAPRLDVRTPRAIFSSPRLCVGTPSTVGGSSQCSETSHWFHQVLPWLSRNFHCPQRVVASVPSCTWRPLHQSSPLWDCTTLKFWSNNLPILPQAPRVKSTLYWWGGAVGWMSNKSYPTIPLAA